MTIEEMKEKIQKMLLLIGLYQAAEDYEELMDNAIATKDPEFIRQTLDHVKEVLPKLRSKSTAYLPA